MNIMNVPPNKQAQERFEKEYAIPNDYDISKYIDVSYTFMETSDAYERWFRDELAKET